MPTCNVAFIRNGKLQKKKIVIKIYIRINSLIFFNGLTNVFTVDFTRNSNLMLLIKKSNES